MNYTVTYIPSFVVLYSSLFIVASNIAVKAAQFSSQNKVSRSLAVNDCVNMESTWNEVTDQKNSFIANAEFSFCSLTKSSDLESLKFGHSWVFLGTVILLACIQIVM